MGDMNCLGLPADLQYVSFALDPANAEASALDILTAFDSSWNDNKDEIKVKRFTGGWTNTLLKAKRDIPGKSKAEIEADAILLRAYGVGTESFIDRENEIKAHSQLSEYGIFPFQVNITKFITHQDVRI
jgi:ethanolamine kinase